MFGFGFGFGRLGASQRHGVAHPPNTLVATRGTFALSGKDAALLYGRNALTAAQGSFGLTGEDATLTYSGAGSKTLTADQGSFALTGSDMAPLVDHTLPAAQGGFTLTGEDATLTYSGAGGGGTTFDPANHSSHISLDATKLIATSGAGSGNGTAAIVNTGYSSGKIWWRFVLTTASGAGLDGVGLANSSYDPNAGTFLGSSNSCSYFNDGSIFGISPTTNPGSYTSGDVIEMAIDVDAGFVSWNKNGGNWFPGNAATPVNDGVSSGADISGLGTPLKAATESEASGGVWTLDASGGTPPTGYSRG